MKEQQQLSRFSGRAGTPVSLLPVSLFTPQMERNGLLRRWSTEARVRLASHAHLVQMRAGQCVVLSPSRANRLAFFPVTAMLALCQETGGVSTQVAFVGREGMVGAVLGAPRALPGLHCVVQSGGAAIAVEAVYFERELARGGSALRAQDWFMRELFAQIAQTAACNRHHAIEQQLARWLLMARDRLDTDEIAATQEDIASLLGVRREGITEAAGRLRDAGAIAQRRGRMLVADPGLLRLRACSCYDLQAASARAASGEKSPDDTVPLVA